MNRIRAWTGVVILAVAALVLLFGADASRVEQDRLGRFRNLGKAFYENPTTQPQAVDEFKKALDLAPNSAREHVNYGLALLRAGRTKEGVAELERAQKLDPKIPHTWFNLGLAFKKEGEYAPAVTQFEGLLKLVPDEPVSHYNLGVLHKLAEKRDDAVREFETAARLNPNLAAPHFQLATTPCANLKPPRGSIPISPRRISNSITSIARQAAPPTPPANWRSSKS